MPLEDPTVSVEQAVAREFAAVRARVPIARVPAVFGQYLDQVYAAGRAGAVQLDGQNIFVYRDGILPGEDAEVEFGVGINAPFVATGAVVPAELPTGEVAHHTHWGDYSKLRNAHDAVIAWCAAHGRKRAGPRWEVYGHWTNDPAQLRTDVYYLLLPSA